MDALTDRVPPNQCTIGTSTDPNCCWGGKVGQDACFRQAKSQSCRDPNEKRNFCANVGIPRSKCGRNACEDPDNCPY
ncbi:hypothetical protein SLS58_007156 [Diplodia intermedia]|uniref:Uncharacterized protein n=1 Tax=Diplodia intermedia TaxID=856260 RepID=A0ABR3TL63_9PEZI